MLEPIEASHFQTLYKMRDITSLHDRIVSKWLIAGS
jgi:hypothetical protein